MSFYTTHAPLPLFFQWGITPRPAGKRPIEVIIMNNI
jgi:hypothetical protein